jgi:hypothetical protein
MKHLDPDISALLALGEQTDSAADREHLAGCSVCQREVDDLQQTVLVARSTLGDAELTAPPARVWEGIRRELDLSEALTPIARSGAVTPIARSGAESTASASGHHVSSLSEARARRSGRVRRFLGPVVASAAAAALIVGAALTWNAASPRVIGEVVASAQLDALPAWNGSTGSAELAQSGNGERILRVSLDAVGSGDGVREVWLLTAEVDGLISLGYLEGATGDFAVPASVDLDQFSVVDVSLEPLDGDPTHSGDSIVRGSLGA